MMPITPLKLVFITPPTLNFAQNIKNFKLFLVLINPILMDSSFNPNLEEPPTHADFIATRYFCTKVDIFVILNIFIRKKIQKKMVKSMSVSYKDF